MKRLLLLIISSVFLLTAAQADVRYVKPNGTGNGSSWDNASPDLQAMINASAAGDEVWVAAGSYQPVTSGTSFSMKSGVKIYGGFPNIGNPVMADRNGTTNMTTLQGNGNSVVSNNNVAATALLDGFTITGGATGLGGGMHNASSSPTLTNCTFLDNKATDSGGGMFNGSSSFPTLTNCRFWGNTATNYGGGISNDNASPGISNCTFSDNTAGNSGGGISNDHASPGISNCTFSGNTASSVGGGIDNFSSSPTISNCAFLGNTANYYGGGISNTSSSPTISNCIFSGNKGRSYGGGIYNYSGSSSTISNCTFSGNTASSGGGISNTSYSTLTIRNSIILGNNTGVYNANSTTTIRYSLVQGRAADAGNHNLDGSSITAADVFAGPVGADMAPTTAGDYRLKAGSIAINAGNNGDVPGNSTDITGGPRIVGNAVDLGAYEYTTVLPVNFSQVFAYIQNNSLYINWRTTTETNNDHFDIEVAAAGRSFYKIGTVLSKATGGNSTMELNYAFSAGAASLLAAPAILLFVLVGFKKRRNQWAMALALGGLLLVISCTKNDAAINANAKELFIRIKQVDKDGRSEYSKTVRAVTE